MEQAYGGAACSLLSESSLDREHSATLNNTYIMGLNAAYVIRIAFLHVTQPAVPARSGNMYSVSSSDKPINNIHVKTPLKKDNME